MLRETDLLIYFLLPWQLGHYAEIFKSYVHTGSLWIPFQNHKRGIRNICSNKRAANLIVLETAYVDSILWHESMKMNQSPELISLILLHTVGLRPLSAVPSCPTLCPRLIRMVCLSFSICSLVSWTVVLSTCVSKRMKGVRVFIWDPWCFQKDFKSRVFFFLAVSLHFAHILFTHVLLLPGARVWCYFVSCQILRAFKKRVSLLLWVSFLFSHPVTHSRHGSAGWRWSARLSGAKVLGCDFAPQEHSAMSGGTFGCPTEC